MHVTRSAGRRPFLGSAAAAATALAGCAGSSPDEKRVPVGQSARGTTVDAVWFRVAFRYRYGAHLRTKASADSQFVFAHVVPARPPADFALAVGDREYGAGDELAGVDVEGIRFGDGHSYDDGRVVGFEVPRDLSADSAAVTWSGGPAAWTLDADAIRRLTSPPSFAVAALDVPDSVAAGAEFEAAATVRNDGGRDGVFLAEAGLATRSDLAGVRLTVPAGGTATWTETFRAPPEGDSVEFRFDWGTDAATRTIALD